MADTTFTSGTVVTSTWLNDINDAVYNNKDVSAHPAFINVQDQRYGTLQSAYNALPATGGVVVVPPGYTETFTSNLVMNKPFSGFMFMGRASIQMGVYKIIMNDSCPGQFIDNIGGQSGGDYWAQIDRGVFFKFTGSGTAIEVGQGTLVAGSEEDCFRVLRGFALNIEYASAGTIGIQVNNQLRMLIEGVNVKAGGGAASAMVGLQLRAVSTGYVGWVNIRDSFFSGGYIGVETVGQCNLSTWIGGGCSTSPSPGVTYGILRGVNSGASFVVRNIEIAGATRAVRVSSGVSYDYYENYGESNTYDVYFDAGASFNTYKRLVMDGAIAVSDGNGAASTNLALQAGDDGAANLYLAGNGGALYGTTSSGANRKLLSTGGSSTHYYGDTVPDILTHQFLAASGSLATLAASGLTVTGGVGVNGAAAQAKSTGWGTPTGNSVVANFNGASATLPQCSAAIAQLITLLKADGRLGA